MHNIHHTPKFYFYFFMIEKYNNLKLLIMQIINFFPKKKNRKATH